MHKKVKLKGDTSNPGYGLFYFADTEKLMTIDSNDERLGSITDAFCSVAYLSESELSNEVGSLLAYLESHNVEGDMLDLARAVISSSLFADLEDISIKEIHDYCAYLKKVRYFELFYMCNIFKYIDFIAYNKCFCRVILNPIFLQYVHLSAVW